MPAGDVDGRSITEVEAGELAGYDQCHFFAGIGGWPLALKFAGVPANAPLWTGSCPCQPFSDSGKGLGEEDSRHLWPEFRRLIADGEPSVIFGEQVASKAGRIWLAGVRADLESLGYAVGAADLCAAGVSAPHIRQRLFWVADTELQRTGAGIAGIEGWPGLGRDRPAIDGATSDERMADTEHDGGGGDQPERRSQGRTADGRDCPGDKGNGWVADADGWNSEEKREQRGRQQRLIEANGCPGWDDYRLVACRDGKARRIESSTQPLAHGIPGRLGLLRGYGNAIIPKVAAEFIAAWVDTKGGVI